MQSVADQLATTKRALVAAEETLRLTRERREFAIGIVLENLQAEPPLALRNNGDPALHTQR